MPAQYFGSNKKTTIQNFTAQPAIADIDTSTVDGTYGAEEQAVIADLQTKVQTLLTQLRAAGIIASS